jgi:dTDP-glucose 4,6-dehydratase
VFADLRPKDDFRYAIDPTKIETELGWRPKHPFSEAFQETVLWFYENFREMEVKKMALCLEKSSF